MMGNDELERQTLRQCLTKEFEIKELGRLKYLIGIEVAYSKQGIFISLQKCAVDLLKEMGKLAYKPANTSVDPNYKLGEAEENIAIDRDLIEDQLLGIAPFLVGIWWHGEVRNRVWWQGLMQKQNFAQWPKEFVNYYG
ncbi:hypothetical protein AAG906_016913 [Vitis piasezkii]